MPARPGLTRAGGPKEWLEDQLKLLGRHARPLVADRQPVSVVLGLQHDPYAALRRGVVTGIAHDILNRLGYGPVTAPRQHGLIRQFGHNPAAGVLVAGILN